MFPPDPCRADLQFLDGDGNVVASRLVRLEAGHAAFLDFAPTFVPVNTVGDVAAPVRAEIRANVEPGRRWTATRPLSRDARNFRQRDSADDGLRGIRASRVSARSSRCAARSVCRRQSGPQRAIARGGERRSAALPRGVTCSRRVHLLSRRIHVARSCSSSTATAEIRANVNLGVAGLPPGPCRATLEIFDNSTARTTVFVASGPRACPRDSSNLPPDPCVAGQDPNGQ